MKLFCVGFNWKTPVGIRERLAFDATQAPQALERLRIAHEDHEFAILSTCNRTEVYAARAEKQTDGLGIEDLCEFIARARSLSLADFYDYLYFHEGSGAALHAFKVASGLDSLVLGEGQITGQVKQAYQTAIEGRTAGPVLHGLFQQALSVAKRVQTETELSKGRLSIASAAVDYLRGVFESFDDKTVLVIGAGKMAELTLTHLRELSPENVFVTNRNRARAEDLVARMGGAVRPFERLDEALVEADIVISSTGAEEAIVDVDQFRKVMNGRRQRLTAIIDIAVPRDFDVEIGNLDNVLLWNIDDLEKVRDRTMRSRESELERALKIVDSEADKYQMSLAIRQSGPVLGKLDEVYDGILEQEWEWLEGQPGELSDQDRRKIRQFAHRVKNKFLHPPRKALRAEAKEGTHQGLLDALRRLFGLHET